MKKVFYLLVASVMLFAVSCDKTKNAPTTYVVNVELTNANGYKPKADVPVIMKATVGDKSVEAKTDAKGIAKFVLTAGVYDVMANDKVIGDGAAFVFNGVKNSLVIDEKWQNETVIKLELKKSKLSQVVVKEVYYGGVPTDDGAKTFNYDEYVVLYNNSPFPAKLDNICLGCQGTNPYKSINKDYINGKLFYEAEGWVPANQAFWHFQGPVSLLPYQEIVIALLNAVDNTKTYSKSINFANPEYYCTYDIDVFNHKLSYPAPATEIPTSHYLKVKKYGAGTGWVFNMPGPAFFIFAPEGETIDQFAADKTKDNDVFKGILVRKKVPVDWVVDGVEIFKKGTLENGKRLNAVIDAGAVVGETGKGYSVYRNVDKAATEAIEGNKGKLIYNYVLGVGESTDPSKIDAEASMKNGAKIVYQDTNNSTNDFHLRSKASLRK